MISKAFCTKFATLDSETYAFITDYTIISKKFDIFKIITRPIHALRRQFSSSRPQEADKPISVSKAFPDIFAH